MLWVRICSLMRSDVQVYTKSYTGLGDVNFFPLHAIQKLAPPSQSLVALSIVNTSYWIVNWSVFIWDTMALEAVSMRNCHLKRQEGLDGHFFLLWYSLWMTRSGTECPVAITSTGRRQGPRPLTRPLTWPAPTATITSSVGWRSGPCTMWGWRLITRSIRGRLVERSADGRMKMVGMLWSVLLCLVERAGIDE